MKSSFECLETWFKKYTYLYNNNSDKNNKNNSNNNNKVSKGMYESVKVDANKESETFSLIRASSGEKEGDYVYDFDKVSN